MRRLHEYPHSNAEYPSRFSLLNDKPYLSVFVLTHPDLDHCQGFEELHDRAPPPALAA